MFDRTERHGFAAPAALLAVAWLVAGCGGPEPPRKEAIYRLVDAELRQDVRLQPAQLSDWAFAEDQERGGIPFVNLADDRRFVLFAPPRTRPGQARLEPSREGRIEVAIPMPPPLSEAETIVLRARARVGDLWVSWPAAQHPIVDLDRGRRGVNAAFRHPLLRAVPDTLLVFEALWAPPEGRSRYETPPITVPPGAELDFAPALASASPGARVRFSVSFCGSEGIECTPVQATSLEASSDAERPWESMRAPLEVVAGRKGRLVFETELEASHDVGERFAAPVWGNPVVTAPSVARPGPSAILISLDTLRADHLSTYGYRRETSPHLDAWARGGTVFERCISAATRTEASHMSMFTSLPPSLHGTTIGLSPLQAPVPTLAEVLRAEGLATAAITENGPLAARVGFGHGFERYVENKSPNLKRPEGFIEDTLVDARTWLLRNRGRRFFLFLHTYQVHSPYEPPAEYRELFAEGPTGSARSVRAQIDDYDREIRYTDDVLAEFLEWLRREGFARDTHVVVTSDHGEEFLEHGLIGHENLPYEELLHVPLIWRGPGIARGRRVAEPVSHLDLAPTLLDLLDAELPPHLRGQSYAGALGSRPGPRADGERTILSESWGKLQEGMEPPAEALRRGQDKLIRLRREGRPVHWLFDLQSDPGERIDRSGERPERLRELRAELEALVDEEAPWPSEPTPALALDPEREEKLRALGYLE